MKTVCECEHVAHMMKHAHTPHGNPGHRYGQPFHEGALTRIRTTYGPFTVCRDCLKDCQEGSEVLP